MSRVTKLQKHYRVVRLAKVDRRFRRWASQKWSRNALARLRAAGKSDTAFLQLIGSGPLYPYQKVVLRAVRQSQKSGMTWRFRR